MLDPSVRQTFMEQLRPPAGFELDAALGTTFSLDLLALLYAPLAFTFFDYENKEGQPVADPLALLDALRRQASRIHLFCQAGQIHPPAKHHLLFGYLESSINEVLPDRGVFHPKVWVLRYVSEQGVRYRLLAATRNMTFDHSWDTLLVLDGEHHSGRRQRFSLNQPLVDFIGFLPNKTLRPITGQAARDLNTIREELQHTVFTPPEGFEIAAFHALGLGQGDRWPFPENRRSLLVMAPFLSKRLLQRLSQGRSDCVLVTRLEEARRQEESLLQGFSRIYTLNPLAQPEEAAEAESEQTHLSGLHAKLYIIDEGWDARIFVGSANATNAGFAQNVEFLIELTGKKRHCGIEALLEDPGFLSLLQPFTPDEAGLSENQDEAICEELLERARLLLSQAGLRAGVQETEKAEEFSLYLKSDNPVLLPAEVRATCRPSTLPHAAAVLAQGPVAVDFGRVSLAGLTTFFAFSLEAASGNAKCRMGFILHLPLDGAPEDRLERLLHEVLRSRDQVLRFLLLMLSSLDSAQSLADLLPGQGTNGQCLDWEQGLNLEAPLLESMLKALSHDPGKLDRVGRFLEDLQRTPEGRELLPEGLDRVWPSIWKVRNEVGYDG